MSKYNNSKIYKIYSSEGEDIYIGSTYRTLEKRLKEHVNNYKAYQKDDTRQYTSSFKLFENYLVKNCLIELLEAVNVETRSELLQIEAKHIKYNKNKCANILLPYCTDEEKAEHKKEYNELPETIQKRKEHNELPEVVQARKEYLQNPAYVEHRKEYRNQPEQRQHRRDYYEKNLFRCECGFVCTPKYKDSHLGSPNHLKYLRKQERLLKLQQQPTIINNYITNIQNVQTFNNINAVKNEKEELEELEKELELSMK